MKLSNIELRVIGCLIEKESTTPDLYPLSLNALTNACNQKSNRDPVMSLDESTVQAALDGLAKKRLVMEKSPFGSRTAKYQHRFCNTEFSDFQFSAAELGVLCMLFLRGAQTPGELRTRTGRLCDFTDVKEVEEVLRCLATHKDGPFVRKLPRQPGRRESRYLHLFGESGSGSESGDGDEQGFETSAGGGSETGGYPQRLRHLEEEVADLRAELDELRTMLMRLRPE